MRIEAGQTFMNTDEVFIACNGNCGDIAQQVAEDIVTSYLRDNKEHLLPDLAGRLDSLGDMLGVVEMLEADIRGEEELYKEHEMRGMLISFNYHLAKQLIAGDYGDERSGENISPDFMWLFANNADNRGVDHLLKNVAPHVQLVVAEGLANFAIQQAASSVQNEVHARDMSYQDLLARRRKLYEGLSAREFIELERNDPECISLSLEIQRCERLEMAASTLDAANQLRAKQ